MGGINVTIIFNNLYKLYNLYIMSFNTNVTINNFNEIDMAIHGYGNFISGYYLIRDNSLEKSYSFLEVNKEKLEKTVFRNLDNNLNNIFNFSDYGNTIFNTGDKLISTDISGIELRNNDTIISDFGDYFTDLSRYMGLNSIINTQINIDKGLTNRRVKIDKCGIGPVFIQAISASLFKSFGKTGSIRNSEEIKSLDYLLSSGIKEILDEDQILYKFSNFLKLYGNSNRIEYFNSLNYSLNYNLNSNSNNTPIFNLFNYNLNNANFDFKVKLSGKLDSGINSNNFYNKVLRSLGTDNLINYDSKKLY